eukprot:jgi/Botrbrau1/4263/Bobra.0390s0003.1
MPGPCAVIFCFPVACTVAKRKFYPMNFGGLNTRSTTGSPCRLRSFGATVDVRWRILPLKSRFGLEKINNKHQWLVPPIRHTNVTTLPGRIFLNRAVESATSTSVRSADTISSFILQRGAPLDKWGARPTSTGEELVLSANRAVSAGSTLVTVPGAAWISPETVSKSKIGKKVADLELWLQLALFLITERDAPGSAFKAYIDLLPQRPNLLVFWSDAELEELAGTQLLESVAAYKAFFQARFEDLDANLFETERSLFPDEVFTYDAFLWAVSSVRARVHPPLEGELVALVPGADLVRHKREGTAKWDIEPAWPLWWRPSPHCRGSKGAGRKLLLDYGVWDSDAAQGAFLLTLSLPAGDPNFDDKADILDQTETFGATWEAGHKFRLLAGRPMDPNLLAFLRLVNLSGPDAFLLEALFRAEAWDHMTLPVSQDNERAVCLSMVDGCRQAMKGYKTTMEEDLRLLPSLKPGSSLDLAVRARLGEKEALTTTLRFFEDRLQRLDNLEYYQERRLRRLGLLDDAGKSTYDSFFEDGIA